MVLSHYYWLMILLEITRDSVMPRLAMPPRRQGVGLYFTIMCERHWPKMSATRLGVTQYFSKHTTSTQRNSQLPYHLFAPATLLYFITKCLLRHVTPIISASASTLPHSKFAMCLGFILRHHWRMLEILPAECCNVLLQYKVYLCTVGALQYTVPIRALAFSAFLMSNTCYIS